MDVRFCSMAICLQEIKRHKVLLGERTNQNKPDTGYVRRVASVESFTCTQLVRKTTLFIQTNKKISSSSQLLNNGSFTLVLEQNTSLGKNL